LSHDVEDTVLGMILSDAGNLDRATSIGVSLDCFHEARNRRIFEEILLQASTSAARIDRRNIVAKLGGVYAPILVEMQSKAPPTQNIEYYARELIAANWQLEAPVKLSRLATAILNRKPFEPMTALVADAHAALRALAEQASPDRMATHEPVELARQFIDEFEKAVITKRDGRSIGITTGLRDLDECFGGWMPSTFNVLGARTSMGKTTLGINFAYAAAEAGKHVVYFTVEMRATRILGKILSRIGRVNGSRIATGEVSDEEIDRLHHALAVYNSSGLGINDRAGRTIEAVESEAWRMHRQKKLDFLIIDYVQQLRCEGKRFQSRHAELGEITARLQDLSHRLEIPVLVLAQLNRQAENLGDDRPPNKAHLKDSGSIEQDADVILLIHRDRKDDPTSRTWVIVDKNRDGKLGPIQVDVDFRYNLFSDFSDGRQT
jgi:replicative DNA helicase